MTRWILRMGALGLLLAGCDGGEPADAGPIDAGEPTDAGEMDAGSDTDAGGLCSELSPQFCPRRYPMDPIPADLICDAFVEPFCRANQECCTRSEWQYPALSTCMSEQRQRCEDLVLKYEFPELIGAGTIFYSQAAAGAQFARAGALASGCNDVDFVQVIMDLYDGQLMFNDSCTATPECPDGLFCEDQGAGLLCRPGLGAGGLCADNTECVSSQLRCDTMMCADRLPVGAGCTDDLDCVSEYCEEGTCRELDAESRYCVRNIGARDYPAFIP